jgi:hypothetical protein
MRELSSNEESISTQQNQKEIKENQEIKFKHGGSREGAGKNSENSENKA